MRIRDIIKKYLPSYRSEARLMDKLDDVNRNIREADKKNEYLFWLLQKQPGETMQEAKERVFLQLPKATGRLRSIQKAENYILQRVKDICDENGLQMFLIGGTLLGAVRHKGFIPWDNDIDIGMLKDDFLKLRAIMKTDEELCAEYYYNYEVGLKIPKIKYRGDDIFWIDVFLFDYINVSSENVEEIWKETQRINLEYSKKLCELAAPYLIDYPGKPTANSVLDEKIEAIEEELNRRFGLFGSGDYVCETLDSPYWSRDPRGISFVADRFPLCKDAVEFEGKKYDVWSNYEQALTKFYGDYWRFPFSVSEPHTKELDEGLDEAIIFLQQKGILDKSSS